MKLDLLLFCFLDVAFDYCNFCLIRGVVSRQDATVIQKACFPFKVYKIVFVWREMVSSVVRLPFSLLALRLSQAGRFFVAGCNLIILVFNIFVFFIDLLIEFFL